MSIILMLHKDWIKESFLMLRQQIFIIKIIILFQNLKALTYFIFINHFINKYYSNDVQVVFYESLI